MIERLPTQVIVEYDRFRGGIPEEQLLQVLRHEPGAGEPDRLVLLAGARVDEQDRVRFQTLLQLHGGEQHLLVVRVALEKGLHRLLHRELVALAHLRQGFVVAIGTRLAAADMIVGKQGPPSTG